MLPAGRCFVLRCFEAFGSFWHLATMYGGEVVGNSWDFCTRHQSIKAINQRWRIWYEVYMSIYIYVYIYICIHIFTYVYIYICQIRHRIVGKRSAFERCILFLVYSLLLAFFSPTNDGPWDSLRCEDQRSGNASRQVWVSWRPRAPAPMVPWFFWWESEGICFPRNPKAWWDSDFYSWLCLDQKVQAKAALIEGLVGTNPKKKPHWITCHQRLCEKSKHKDSGNARLSWAPTHRSISFW